MAVEKVVNLKVTDDFKQTEENVKSLRAQMREAQAEVAKMADKFGATSQQAIEAAKRAAELKDKIDDARESVQLFDPGKRFQAFTTGAQQLAAGFSAVQGAMALAGSESEDLQKQMLKVQGAIALTQGLSELKDLGKSYQQLKIVAVDAFKGIKVAIGSTGIGLLVVALGTLVAYWDDIKKAVTDAFPALKNTETVLNKLKEVAYGVGNAIKTYILSPFKAIGKLLTGDFSGAVAEIKKGIDFVGNYSKGAADQRQAQLEEAQKKRLQAIIDQKDKEIEVEKARGNDTYAQELANIKRRQQLAKDDQEELAKLKQQERVLIASHQKQLADKQAAHNKELQAKQKEHADKLKQQREQQHKEEQESIRRSAEGARTELENAYQIQADAIAKVADLTKTEQQKEIDAVKQKYADKIAALQKAGLDTSALTDLQANEINDINLKYQQKQYQDEAQLSEGRKQIAHSEAQAKIAAADAVANTLMSVAQLAGEQTAVGKGLAIASTLISTFTSAQKAYEATVGIPFVGPILAPINAGLAVAAGIKNLQAINSVPVPGASGGAGGGIAAAGGAAPAPPNFNIVGQNSSNQLAQTIAGKQAQPVKAYVVSGEVTTGQALDRNKINTATFN